MRTAIFLLALVPAPALAQSRDFCPDRPGLGTPPCTIDKGRGDIEIGLVDWTLDKQGGARTDSWIFSDTLVRYGVTDSLEVQLGWTAYGFIRERSAAGSVDHSSGTGDLKVALRQNLVHPDGSGFSVAVMPYATLPTGGRTLGAGTWSAGLLLPVSYQLPHDFALSLTGRIEAAADEDRHGRHLAYGGIAGLDVPLGDQVSATLELSAQREEESGAHKTEMLAGLSFAYTASPDLQLDGGVNAGLSRSAPDAELYVGLARRF